MGTFGIMERLSRAYLGRPVLYSAGAAIRWFNDHDNVTIVTSPRAHAAIEPRLGARKFRVIIDPPIEVAELQTIATTINTPWVAGIGAGRVMDAAKYLALHARRKLCLVPSALSTTSWLNMAIALRERGRLCFPGHIHARVTIVDPDFISEAPFSLTLGGLVDVMAACTAVTDWMLSHEETGEKISRRGVAAFKSLVNQVLESEATFTGERQRAIRAVYDTFLQALALCGASFSGRPVEGSEHFLYYLAEEICTRRFVHGEIIGLMMLVSLHLQGSRAMVEPARMKDFLDGLGLRHSPRDLGIARVEMEQVLRGARAFVAERNHPFSILNVFDPEREPETLKATLEWIFSS